MPAIETPWDRLRAAFDAWEAPRGLSLAYTIDERSGRFAFRLAAECGGSVVADFAGRPSDRDLEKFVGQVTSRLDYAAFDLLHDHLCCQGRLPRPVARAWSYFERWVDDYRRTIRDRAAEEKWQC